MRLVRSFCTMLACAVIISCPITIDAAETREADCSTEIIVERATGRFSLDVPANTAIEADASFPLEVGEAVTIKASYTPSSASVDFGLIAPDGLFYSVNVTNGNIDQTIVVNQRGNYTFAIRNNSFLDVIVVGFLNY